MTPVVDHVGVFGKVPRLGDFVHVGAETPLARAFEELLTHSLALSMSRAKDVTIARLSAGEPFTFVLRPMRARGPGPMLCGVVAPSEDSVGRRFPIVVHASFDPTPFVRRAHLLPLLLQPFFDHAAGVVTRLDEVTSPVILERRVVGLRDCVHLDSFAPLALDYDERCETTSQSAAWSAIFGSADLRAPQLALHTMLESAAPLRGAEWPASPLAIRVPTGTAPSLGASLLLDLFRRACRWQSTTPTFFSTMRPRSGSILLRFGDPTNALIADLWMPDPDSETVSDLTSPTSIDASRFAGRMPRAVAAVLERPDLPISSLLQAMGT